MLHEVWLYEDDILSGKIPSGRLLKLSIERSRRDFERLQSEDNYPYYFDCGAAQQVIDFFELCYHWQGSKAGTPIELEPNQKWRIAMRYGWKIRKSSYRRYKKSYTEVARKNGKTTELALGAIFHLALDGEIGSSVVSGSNKEEQARIVVNDAGKIIEATPELQDEFGFQLFKLKGDYNKIYCESSNSNMFSIGSDSKKQDGLKPERVYIDEYHGADNDSTKNVLSSGTLNRPNRSVDVITTAGFDKTGPCYSVERKNAIDVLEGTAVDESLFVAIYCPDEEDEEVIKKMDIIQDTEYPPELVNIIAKGSPNLGASVEIDQVVGELIDAQNKGGSAWVNFVTKNLNMWVDAPSTWIPSEVWARNTIYNDIQMWTAKSEPFGNNTYLKQHRIVSLEYVEQHLQGQTCYGGLDLSSKLDFSALVYVFDPDEDGIVSILPYVWTTEAYLKKMDLANAYEWVNEGFLTACKGELISHRMIFEKIKETFELFDVRNIAYDAAFAGSIIEDCADEYGELLVSFGQGIMKVSEPTKLIESTCYAQGSEEELQGFEHFNNPVLSWMIGNVEIIRDHNANIRITKKEAKKNKVDAVSALVNAMAMQLYYDHVEGGTITFIDYDQTG